MPAFAGMTSVVFFVVTKLSHYQTLSFKQIKMNRNKADKTLGASLKLSVWNLHLSQSAIHFWYAGYRKSAFKIFGLI